MRHRRQTRLRIRKVLLQRNPDIPIPQPARRRIPHTAIRAGCRSRLRRRSRNLRVHNPLRCCVLHHLRRNIGLCQSRAARRVIRQQPHPLVRPRKPVRRNPHRPMQDSHNGRNHDRMHHHRQRNRLPIRRRSVLVRLHRTPLDTCLTDSLLLILTEIRPPFPPHSSQSPPADPSRRRFPASRTH